MLQTDLPRRSTSNERRSSSPLSVCECEVRPIAEQSEEHAITCIKRSSVASDDDDSDRDSIANDDYRKGDEEDVYGDIEDLDAEQDSSHSPLLSEKHEMMADNKGNRSSVCCSFTNFVTEWPNKIISWYYIFFISDLTSNLPSFSRKKYYVDSLTRKYKRASTRASRTSESLVPTQSEPQSNFNLELKTNEKNFAENSCSESVYNGKFNYLFTTLFAVIHQRENSYELCKNLGQA